MEGSTRHASKSALTRESLESFLARLDPDKDRAGKTYEQVHRKLVTFFCGRGAGCPEELADETLDRVIRRLGEVEVVNLTGYILGVARRVASEASRTAHAFIPLAEAAEPSRTFNIRDDAKERLNDLRAECLDRSLQLLDSEQRSLIVEWYLYDKTERIENKRRLAVERRTTTDTLRVQAYRARQKLQRLVNECIESSSTG